MRLSRRRVLGAALGAATLGALNAACQAPAAAPPAGAPPALVPTRAAAATPAPAASAASASAPVAAPLVSPRRPLKLAWTALSGSYSAVWMAHETDAWKELGLDTELVRINSSSRMAAAMQAGEVDAGTLDWAFAFQFAAQGGNARQIAAITNRVIFSVVSVPSVQRPQDVVGKRWGITRFGSAAHTASLLALEAWGLRPEDVQFLQLQELNAIMAAMQAGQCDIGVLSPPTSTRGIQLGLHELLNLATDGPEYPSLGLGIAERYVTGDPAVARAVVAGYAQGVARFRKDPERAVAVIGQYLQLDDRPLLQDLQRQASQFIAYPPVLPMATLLRIKQDVVEDDARVAGVQLTDVAAPRFADELQAQGYFASLL